MDLKTIKIFSSKREKSALKSDKPHKFNKRKLLTLPLSFALAFGMFSFPASGAGITILPGDLDGDGVQSTVGDMLLLGRLLANQQTIINWSRADLNGDGTVSLSDLHMLQDQMLNGAALSPSRTETRTGWEGQTISFDVYDYDIVANNNGNPTSTPVKRTGADYPYEISTVSPNSSAPVGTPNFIDLDGDYSNRSITGNTAIVQLFYNRVGATQLSYGTGIVVGENMILTAAHCAYNVLNLSANLYAFNENGLRILGSDRNFYISEVHIPEDFYLNFDPISGEYSLPSSVAHLDFALLIVEDDDLLGKNDNYMLGDEEQNTGNDVVPLELGVALNSLINQPVSIIGYPVPVPSISPGGYKNLFIDTEIINGFVTVNNTTKPNSSIENFRLITQAVSSRGQSGGAHLNQNNVVIAIVSGGENYDPPLYSGGVRITPLIYMFVNHNPNLS